MDTWTLESCETLYRDAHRIADVDVYYGEGKWWMKDLDTNVITPQTHWEDCVQSMYHDYNADKIMTRGRLYM